MTSTELSGAAGLLLSLLFSYTPGLNTRFAALEPTTKRLVMAGLLLLVALGAFGAVCAGLLPLLATCDRPGALGLLTNFIAALVANQATYALSPLPAGLGQSGAGPTGVAEAKPRPPQAVAVEDKPTARYQPPPPRS